MLITEQEAEEAIRELELWIEHHEGFRPYSEGFKRCREKLGLNTTNRKKVS